MTFVAGSGNGVVVVQGADAEVLGDGTQTSVRLTVDTSSTGAALSGSAPAAERGGQGHAAHELAGRSAPG